MNLFSTKKISTQILRIFGLVAILVMSLLVGTIRAKAVTYPDYRAFNLVETSNIQDSQGNILQETDNIQNARRGIRFESTVFSDQKLLQTPGYVGFNYPDPYFWAWDGCSNTNLTTSSCPSTAKTFGLSATTYSKVGSEHSYTGVNTRLFYAGQHSVKVCLSYDHQGYSTPLIEPANQALVCKTITFTICSNTLKLSLDGSCPTSTATATTTTTTTSTSTSTSTPTLSSEPTSSCPFVWVYFNGGWACMDAVVPANAIYVPE